MEKLQLQPRLLHFITGFFWLVEYPFNWKGMSQATIAHIEWKFGLEGNSGTFPYLEIVF